MHYVYYVLSCFIAVKSTHEILMKIIIRHDLDCVGNLNNEYK